MDGLYKDNPIKMDDLGVPPFMEAPSSRSTPFAIARALWHSLAPFGALWHA